MENIEIYRKKLQAEHDRLTAEIEENSKTQDFGSDIDGLDEEADEGESLANNLAIAESLKEELSEIESAIARIENGTYGVCINCQGKISEEVLNAAPESSLCSNCKKES